MERVSKKSFIITTILMPLVMLALMLAPVLIAEFSESENRKVLVIDNSANIAKSLKNTPELSFTETDIELDSARNAPGIDAVLVIPAEALTGNATLQLYSNDASSMSVESAIVDQVNEIVEKQKLASYNIDNLL